MIILDLEDLDRDDLLKLRDSVMRSNADLATREANIVNINAKLGLVMRDPEKECALVREMEAGFSDISDFNND